jgi:hypothetical protein
MNAHSLSGNPNSPQENPKSFGNSQNLTGIYKREQVIAKPYRKSQIHLGIHKPIRKT